MPKLFSTMIKLSLLVCMMFIAGCKEVLYSSLDERQSAEMIRVLQHNGISAARVSDKDGLYAVSVSNRVLGVSVAILNEVGLPKVQFRSMEDMFPADSIVGTPFEEKARYSFALSQELSATLSEISGVQSARVHIMIPEKDRFETQPRGSTASVAIYHTQTFDQTSFVPKIKQLVANAVPDLVYDNVVIALFAAQTTPIGAGAEASVPGGAQASTGSAGFFGNFGENEQTKTNLLLLALMLGLLVVILRGLRKIWFWMRPVQ